MSRNRMTPRLLFVALLFGYVRFIEKNGPHGKSRFPATKRIQKTYEVFHNSWIAASRFCASRSAVLMCCETLGMFFGSVSPKIWIFPRAVVQIETKQRKQGGTGFWFDPKHRYFLATIIRLFACDFNNLLATRNRGKEIT